MATTKTRMATKGKEEVKPAQPVAVLRPTRLPIAPGLATEYDIRPTQWRVLVDQIFPQAKTVEAVMMALEYCRHRNLDIFKRPVHIVPMWSNQLGRMVETVWPGIAEIRTTAARTNAYAGMDPMSFGDDVTVTFEGEIEVWENGSKKWTKASKEVTFPEWVDCTVWRIVQGVRVPFTTRTWWEETYASIGKSGIPNDMWEKRPRGQICKCAEAASLRAAFPEELGSTYAAEEMEGRTIEGSAVAMQQVQPVSGPPTAAPKPAKVEPKIEEEDPKPLTPEEVEKFLTDLDANLSAGQDWDTCFEIWDKSEVEKTLYGNDEALERAFAISKRHAARVEKTRAPETKEDGQTYT